MKVLFLMDFRTKEQAVSLNEVLNNHNLSITKTYYFDLNLEESINRISGRMIDSRNNEIYHKQTNPPPESAIPF